ncbi:MAG: hypothetical protein R2698_08820 [Microthrixaceae bacterium]
MSTTTMLAAQIRHEWDYVIAAWVITTIVLGAYAVMLVRRGRRLARRVPPDRRRWM